METSRFFVANLPLNTKENDLRQIFQDYGEIKSIELKTKDNLVDPTDVKVIAFVTLYIGADDAHYALKDLNWCKVNGQQIKVSVAKESFLERLKREREEAQLGSSASQTLQQTNEEEQSELLKAPKENKRKTFDIDVDLDDDDVAIELMVTKKRAANSIFNGKIVIQSQDVQPIHIIETQKKNKQKVKSLMDDKNTSADQKRKESLNKKKQQYQLNKTAIQQALQGLDGSNVASKKIKFSYNESDQEESKDPPNKKSKTNIFGSDDEEDFGDVQIKDLPFGKKGERLLEMQAKQSLDPRFKIDAKFVDGLDQDENECADNEVTPAENEDDERQWQMNILEQVVGTKLDTHPVGDKKRNKKKMLHYDPDKDEHQKYEKSKEDMEKEKKQKQKNKTMEQKENKPENVAEVSKEVFYVVSDSLQKSLRTRGEGFSLLDMFGQSEHLETRDEQLKQLGKEKILVNNNKLEKTFSVNPFSYDSSSESEGEEIKNDKDNVSTLPSEEGKSNKKKSKLIIASESFFIPKNDKRLKEGAKFFMFDKDRSETTENYEEVRNRLKLLIKNKISKSKKNLAKAGYKGKRRKA